MRINTNAIDKHIGNRIRMRRAELGLSQTELAETMDLSFQQVQKYEKGINRVGGSRMMQIAVTLGVSPGYFYEGLKVNAAGIASAPPRSIMDDFIASDEGITIARALVRVHDPKVRQIIVKAVRDLCGALEPELQAAE